MLRAVDLASASWPFCCWPRKAGRAIAARMPMIRITTRSSMSVKPFSSLLIRWESFRSMCTPPWSLWSLSDTSCSPQRCGGSPAGSGRMSLPPEPRSFASPPRDGFAFSTAVLTLACVTYRPFAEIPDTSRTPLDTTQRGEPLDPPLGETSSVGASRLPLVALRVGGLAATLADVVAATRRDTRGAALRDREVRPRLRGRRHGVARGTDGRGGHLTAVRADVEARVRERGSAAVRVHAGVVGRAGLDLRHEVAGVRLRLRVLALLLLAEEGRQGDRGKNADDEDHHEELDERKALLLAVDPLGKLPQHLHSSLGACGLASHLGSPLFGGSSAGSSG